MWQHLKLRNVKLAFLRDHIELDAAGYVVDCPPAAHASLQRYSEALGFRWVEFVEQDESESTAVVSRPKKGRRGRPRKESIK